MGRKPTGPTLELPGIGKKKLNFCLKPTPVIMRFSLHSAAMLLLLACLLLTACGGKENQQEEDSKEKNSSAPASSYDKVSLLVEEGEFPIRLDGKTMLENGAMTGEPIEPKMYWIITGKKEEDIRDDMVRVAAASKPVIVSRGTFEDGRHFVLYGTQIPNVKAYRYEMAFYSPEGKYLGLTKVARIAHIICNNRGYESVTVNADGTIVIEKHLENLTCNGQAETPENERVRNEIHQRKTFTVEAKQGFANLIPQGNPENLSAEDEPANPETEQQGRGKQPAS